MIFISVKRIRSLAMKMKVFLTVCCVLSVVPCTRLRAQSASVEINPVDVSAHPRVREEARATPSKAITKRTNSLSLWSSQPAKEPANTLFRLGKANSSVKTALSANTSLPGSSESSPNAQRSGGGSSRASSPVNALTGFSQTQSSQRLPNSPLLKDAWGLVTLQPKMHGLGFNVERNRAEFGSISSSRKFLSARSVQSTLKRPSLQQKKPSSSPPSAKRPIN